LKKTKTICHEVDHNSLGLEYYNPSFSRVRVSQKPPLLAVFICLVISYVMSCDHYEPTCVMHHILELLAHTPVKIVRVSSNNSCNTSSTLGQVVLTPVSPLKSYITPINQHESFVRTLSSLTRTREDFPVGQPSKYFSRPSLPNLEVLSRQTSKKIYTLLVWILY
jgi:hypothetical protein